MPVSTRVVDPARAGKRKLLQTKEAKARRKAYAVSMKNPANRAARNKYAEKYRKANGPALKRYAESYRAARKA